MLGGLLGALTGWLAPQGKGRSLVLGAFTLMIAVGLIHLAVGLYAVLSGQPYAIWYPLLLIGFILSVVMGALRPVARKRYEEVEARRMEAAVLRRG